jgi:hypothetical protein
MNTVSIYVAFSIHGTNAFITAVKVVPKQDLSKELSALAINNLFAAKSRREDFNKDTEVKLHWSSLLTQQGKPLRNPSIVLHRMRKLAAHGFTLNETEFLARHFNVWKA